MKVDLNADMGESFGAWTMGNDAALLDIVTSANIACGFHAGDPDVMALTMALAVQKGVGIGAHPGFADLKGFGRRRLPIPAKELVNAMTYQLGAAQGMARAAGGQVRHFKIHGALNNMACENEALARTLFEAALKVDPDIVIVALPGTAMEPVLTDLGCQWAAEIFADRAYNDDLTLVDRSLPGAVLHDPAEAASRMVDMVKTGKILTASGNRIPARIDTICVHGDGPEALAIARSVRNALEAADVTVARL
ncbi:LamB/YcsF family protein [Aestuariibius insulae]|uniref:LamB/YcsF family protein n=1 Tax=Aestuariibius insulae TaxID=2058287 RepID=UPI00345EFF52